MWCGNVLEWFRMWLLKLQNHWNLSQNVTKLLAYIPYHISKTISIGIQMLMFYHLFPTRIAIKWAIHHFQTSHMVGLCIYIHIYIYISHYISEYLPLYSYSMHNITYPMIFHSYIPVCVCVYILYIYIYLFYAYIP